MNSSNVSDACGEVDNLAETFDTMFSNPISTEASQSTEGGANVRNQNENDTHDVDEDIQQYRENSRVSLSTKDIFSVGKELLVSEEIIERRRRRKQRMERDETYYNEVNDAVFEMTEVLTQTLQSLTLIELNNDNVIGPPQYFRLQYRRAINYSGR